MGSSMSMVRSSQHSARRLACDGGKAGSRLKMVLVCFIVEMSKAGSGSNSPNSLGVGTRIGSVLAVSMTLRQRSSHRLSELVPGSASDGGGSGLQHHPRGAGGRGGEEQGGGGVGKAAAGAGEGGVLALLWPVRDGGCG